MVDDPSGYTDVLLSDPVQKREAQKILKHRLEARAKNAEDDTALLTLEDTIADIENIDSVTSVSQDGFSSIIANFDPSGLKDVQPESEPSCFEPNVNVLANCNPFVVRRKIQYCDSS